MQRNGRSNGEEEEGGDEKASPRWIESGTWCNALRAKKEGGGITRGRLDSRAHKVCTVVASAISTPAYFL